jgi:histidinol-phosphate aminotransferase
MTTQWESLANEHILGIAPYEPGKPTEELERELGIHDAIKLASNENPLSPSDRVQQAIIAALPHLNRYPDGSGYYLRQALAEKHEVTPDHVILGNGSNELIELVVRSFLKSGDEAVVPHPSFVVYPMIVQAAGGIRVMVMLKDHRLDLEAMARAITPMTKIVFIANPNNPTATIVTKDEVAHFMSRVPERTIVVFDEAYLEFAQGPGFPRHARAGQAGAQGRRAADLLQGQQPGRPAHRLRRRRRRLHRADEPHPPAVQRERARAGGGAGRARATSRTRWSACG